jgi:hypothetical protein
VGDNMQTLLYFNCKYCQHFLVKAGKPICKNDVVIKKPMLDIHSNTFSVKDALECKYTPITNVEELDDEIKGISIGEINARACQFYEPKSNL